MNAQELLDKLLLFQEVTTLAAQKVVVVVRNDRTTGGTPVSEVTDVCCGFDWDHGRLMIRTKEILVRETKTPK